MKAAIDLTGQRFGRLTACFPHSIKRVDGKNPRYYYWCNCDCGISRAVVSGNLTLENTKSCGCLQREQMETRNSARRHGRVKDGEYRAWAGAKSRCFNQKNHAYSRYGGRGITMCDRWKNSFKNFLEDMGNRLTPNHSLDRIDNDGDYCPENCRWATPTEQANNTHKNHRITIGGFTLTVAEWARKLEVDPDRIHDRLKIGWSEVDAIFLPVEQRIKAYETREHYIALGCETLSIADWAKKMKISPKTISTRLARGWCEQDAVCTPFRKLKPRSKKS